jgi:hypothetical protein
MLGADPGRALRLPGEAEGQDAAVGAGGSRIVLRLRLAASHQECNIAVLGVHAVTPQPQFAYMLTFVCSWPLQLCYKSMYM